MGRTLPLVKNAYVVVRMMGPPDEEKMPHRGRDENVPPVDIS